MSSSYRLLILLLLLPFIGFSQSEVFRFTGRFDVSQVDEVTSTTWNLTGQFVDLTGSYTGLDADTNNIIFQRGYDVNGKMVYDPYRVIGIISQDVNNIVVKVQSDWPLGILNSSGYPYTGSFPIATSVFDTLKLINRTSFYLNQIDPDYEAALDNYNLYWLTMLAAAYPADSADLKDTLRSHNTRINARALKTTTISTTSPLTGGGDLSTNRTFALDTTKAILFNDTLTAGKIQTKYGSRVYLTAEVDGSITNEGSLKINNDLPYSVKISSNTLGSDTLVLTAREFLKGTLTGNEYSIESDTTKLVTFNDTLSAGKIATKKALADGLALKRNLNNHDSLSTLDEKSFNSLTDKPTIPTGSNYFAKADSNTNANATTKKYVDGLIAGKANTSHSQAISTVTGLQDSLTDSWNKRDTATVLLNRARAASTYQPKGTYLTAETDPNISAWARSATKPSYTYSEVGAAAASHAHGNVTSAGYIGTSATLPIITGTGGILQAGSFGTAAGSFCQGNDGRLSDSRVASDVYDWAKASVKPSYIWSEIGTGTRTNYNLDFKASTGDYAGFRFTKSSSADGSGNAGYLLIKDGADNGVYTTDGITLVADLGWLTLAQRTTASKGIRFMTGTSAVSRMEISTAGAVTIGGNTVYHEGNVPTWNQSTTGTAAGLTAQYIDWNSASGGSSIANKPTLQTIINGTGFVKASGTGLSYDNSTYVTGTPWTTWAAPASTVSFPGFGTTHALSAYGDHNHALNNLSEKSYNNLTDKPSIPAAQIQSDWNQTSTGPLDYIKNKPTIPAAQVYPGAGVPYSNGSVWSTSVDTTQFDTINLNPTKGITLDGSDLISVNYVNDSITIWNGMYNYRSKVTIADDGEISFPAGCKWGWGRIITNYGATYADFRFEYNGNITWSIATDDASQTWEDGHVCIYWDADMGHYWIANRLGSSKPFLIDISYSTTTP